MNELYVVVKGNVTGVGFRAWVSAQATRLGLNGWVRNKEERVVEAVFQGNPKALDKIIALVKEGSAGSKVKSVENFWRNSTGNYDGFRIV